MASSIELHYALPWLDSLRRVSTPRGGSPSQTESEGVRRVGLSVSLRPGKVLASTSNNEYGELFQTPIRAVWSYIGRSDLRVERIPIEQFGSSGENGTAGDPGRSAR